VSLVRVALVVALLAITSSASAAALSRHFEPDDLELEDPGTLDLDLQMGPMRGTSSDKNHVFLPDFEIGLGFAPNVQLELDGTISEDDFDSAHRHFSSDPLWVATKLGLLAHQDEHGNVWAIGLELGPRLPILDSAGIGYGAVGLFGFSHHGFHLVLNAGGLIDPGATLHAEHPRSAVIGLDLNADLDKKGIWSVQSELGSVYYFSSDPNELSFTVGATYAVTPKLDVSATALLGFLPGTDHAGILLGASPQIDLW
jgi:hypothetical protein